MAVVGQDGSLADHLGLGRGTSAAELASVLGLLDDLPHGAASAAARAEEGIDAVIDALSACDLAAQHDVTDDSTTATAADEEASGHLVGGPDLAKRAARTAVHVLAEEHRATVAAAADSMLPGLSVSHFDKLVFVVGFWG